MDKYIKQLILILICLSSYNHISIAWVKYYGEDSPRFSADGKCVIFESDRDGFDNLYAVDLDGSNLRQITHITDNKYSGLHLDRDMKKVYYTNCRPEETSEWPFCVMNIDGTRKINLKGIRSSKPVYTADGNWEFYTLNGKIYKVDLSSLEANRIEGDYTYYRSLAVSYNGERIYFIGRIGDFDRSLCLSNSDGSVLVSLPTPGYDSDSGFSLSSLGDKIAYKSDYAKISIIDVGKSTSEIISMEAGGIFNVVISPKGDRLAFVYGNMNDYTEIYSVKVDGTGLKRLTTALSVSYHCPPAFSPSGNKIAFTVYSQGSGSFIAIINSDGSRQMRLTGYDRILR